MRNMKILRDPELGLSIGLSLLDPIHHYESKNNFAIPRYAFSTPEYSYTYGLALLSDYHSNAGNDSFVDQLMSFIKQKGISDEEFATYYMNYAVYEEIFHAMDFAYAIKLKGGEEQKFSGYISSILRADFSKYFPEIKDREHLAEALIEVSGKLQAIMHLMAVFRMQQREDLAKMAYMHFMIFLMSYLKIENIGNAGASASAAGVIINRLETILKIGFINNLEGLMKNIDTMSYRDLVFDMNSIYTSYFLDDDEKKQRLIETGRDRIALPPLLFEFEGDSAMAAKSDALILDKATKGGIDLNPTIINTEIKRNGRGVIIPAFKGAVPDLNGMEGFVPNIINVTPVTNLQLLLGLDTKSNENPQHPKDENEKPVDVSFNLSALPAKEREELSFELVNN